MRVYKKTSLCESDVLVITFPEKNVLDGGGLYRIRTGSYDYNRENLFHVPEKDRGHIRPYRYIIAGYPCLYLADKFELCWFECGMPSDFSVAKFKVDTKNRKPLKFIDFTANPLNVAHEAQIYYMNKLSSTEKMDEYLLKYLISYPLRCACSISVANRGLPFYRRIYFSARYFLGKTKCYSHLILTSGRRCKLSKDCWSGVRQRVMAFRFVRPRLTI